MAKDAVAIHPLVDVDGNERVEGRNLVEEWTTTLVSRGVPVVERTRLDAVLKELNLQQTKEFDPEKAKKVGKQIGAATVMTGTIVVSKSGYAVAQLRLIRVDTGEIVLAIAHNMGRVAVQTTLAGANAVKLPGNVKTYTFTNEKEINENWEIHGDWRMENGGVKLNDGPIITSDRIRSRSPRYSMPQFTASPQGSLRPQVSSLRLSVPIRPVHDRCSLHVRGRIRVRRPAHFFIVLETAFAFVNHLVPIKLTPAAAIEPVAALTKN